MDLCYKMPLKDCIEDIDSSDESSVEIVININNNDKKNNKSKE